MTPTSEAEVAEAIRDGGGGWEIAGGQTRAIGHDVSGGCLSTAALTGITRYEPGALTLVVRAGTPLAEVKATLATEGQMLPFEPWDARRLTGRAGAPTIGGMVAVNASGPPRVSAGACRDLLLGVRFVDGVGTITRNGGRVMKNVTGIDLARLLAGSHGTLGVITEVAFKVLPAPEATTTLVIQGLDPEGAGQAMRLAMASLCDVTGAAHLGGLTGLRLEGLEGSVRHRAGMLRAVLSRFGDVEERAFDWAAVRDAAPFAGRAGAVWRVSTPPSGGPEVGTRLNGAEIIYDWAGGLLWVLAPETLDVRAALRGIAGHATIIRASRETKARFGVFQDEPPPVAGITKRLRALFDPHRRLNAGRLGAEI